MPTFRAYGSAATNGAVFLLPFPSVDWFSWAILGAVTEMTMRENWWGEDEAHIDYALREANNMLAGFKLLNFNPFPIGLITPFGGEVAPAGYLLCDGAEYAVADYPELWGQVGYSFGGADDVFNVPDLRSRVVVGASDTRTYASSGGEETVTLSVDEMPTHTHIDTGHAHSITLNQSFPTQEGVGVGRLLEVFPLIEFTGTASANLTNTGGGAEHENMQPYTAITYVIYAGRENAI